MSEAAGDQLDSLLSGSDKTIWCTAAVVLAIQGAASAEQQAAAHAVLKACGVDGVASLGAKEAGGLAARAAAPIHQVAALLRGEGQMWAAQSDEALVAQGRTSARGATMFAEYLLPVLAGLQEALAGDARMLDVGTGVASMAVAYAELFPRLTVVGIDVMSRALALAEQTLAVSSVSDRIILRQQDVVSLDEPETYAFAWLPAPFIPESALGPGVLRVVESLLPGGWLMLGHGKYGGSEADDAVGRFKTLAYGGTALNDEQAEEMLRVAGLVEVRTVPTANGAPAITVGRKPTTS